MATPTNYNVNDYLKGVNGFGAPFCNLIYSATLGAASEQTVTVPNTAAKGAISSTTTKNRFLAVFSYEAAANVWVALNATAAVPAGGTFAATTSELNPPAKVVKGGDVIHAITANANTDVSIALYAIQEA
jgi:hypothetical protein